MADTGINAVNMLELISGSTNIDNSVNTSEKVNGEFDEIYDEAVEKSESLDDIFKEAADKYGLDINLLMAVAKAESGFDTEAVSSCGAMGIMQLMPSVAESYGLTDPFDARQNIDAGANALSWLLNYYDNNVTLALAGYNAGCGNVDKYGGVPPFGETEAYINKINGFLGGSLSNDSWQIGGSSDTDLTHANSLIGEAEGITVNSETKGRMLTYGSNVTDGNIYTSNATDGNTYTGLGISSTDEDLSYVLDYEDYLYVKETIADALEKLLENNANDDKKKDDDSSLDIYANAINMPSPLKRKLLNSDNLSY